MPRSGRLPCTIKNQHAATLAGGVPFAEVFPELWVIRDEDYDQAKELLRVQAMVGETGQSAWVCSGCGERHASEFTSCWKCGKEKGSNSKNTPQILSRVR